MPPTRTRRRLAGWLAGALLILPLAAAHAAEPGGEQTALSAAVAEAIRSLGLRQDEEIGRASCRERV